tara:strand:+ start:186 stop:548 length:363 start_codon:yes stop_codon:yes gene_type:complete
MNNELKNIINELEKNGEFILRDIDELDNKWFLNFKIKYGMKFNEFKSVFENGGCEILYYDDEEMKFGVYGLLIRDKELNRDIWDWENRRIIESKSYDKDGYKRFGNCVIKCRKKDKYYGK